MGECRKKERKKERKKQRQKERKNETKTERRKECRNKLDFHFLRSSYHRCTVVENPGRGSLSF
jgi:hypothetical protein